MENSPYLDKPLRSEREVNLETLVDELLQALKLIEEISGSIGGLLYKAQEILKS